MNSMFLRTYGINYLRYFSASTQMLFTKVATTLRSSISCWVSLTTVMFPTYRTPLWPGSGYLPQSPGICNEPQVGQSIFPSTCRGYER